LASNSPRLERPSMTLDEFADYCLSKPGVTANYPIKGDAV
jgi:hypothetical protein